MIDQPDIADGDDRLTTLLSAYLEHVDSYMSLQDALQTTLVPGHLSIAGLNLDRASAGASALSLALCGSTRPMEERIEKARELAEKDGTASGGGGDGERGGARRHVDDSELEALCDWGRRIKYTYPVEVVEPSGPGAEWGLPQLLGLEIAPSPSQAAIERLREAGVPSRILSCGSPLGLRGLRLASLRPGTARVEPDRSLFEATAAFGRAVGIVEGLTRAVLAMRVLGAAIEEERERAGRE